MRIDVRTNVREFLADMGTLRMKQAPFVARQAIDATANDIGQALENRMRQVFRYSPQGWRFIARHVKVMRTGSGMARGQVGRARSSRAGGGDFRAWVGIIPPPSKGEHAGWHRYRGSFIAALDAGGPTPGPKRFGGQASGPLSDFGRYAIPVARSDARPRFPLRMWPVNLGLSARQTIDGAVRGGGLRGKHRTFLVPIRNARGHSMIFQRFGRGKSSDVMPIFWVVPQTRLPAKRYFGPTVDLITRTRLSMHLERAMQHALFGRGAYRG